MVNFSRGEYMSRIYFNLQTMAMALFVLFIFEGTVLAGPNVSYYDISAVKIDYRGVRFFIKPMRSLTRHMKSNWDYYIVYRDKKNRILKSQYRSNGNIVFEDYYHYDGSDLSKVVTFLEGKPYQSIIIGDDEDKVKKIMHQSKVKVVYHYKDAKILQKLEYLDKNDKLLSSRKYFYNDKSLREKVEFYNSKNKLLEYEKISYKRGLKTKTASYTPDNKLLGYTVFVYNRGAQLESEREYDSRDRLLGSRIYQYSDRGSLRYIQHYDEKGRLVVK